MYPYAERFGLYSAEIFILHYWGEIVCVACMGVFMNPNQANSTAALFQAASVLISSGLLKYVSHLCQLLILIHISRNLIGMKKSFTLQ